MKRSKKSEKAGDPSRGLIEESSRRMLATAGEMGANRWAAGARAWCVNLVFNRMEEIFVSGNDPVGGMNDLFERVAVFLSSSIECGINRLGQEPAGDPAAIRQDQAAVEDATGQYYGRLFREFSQASFWEEPLELLRTRLERNNVDLPDLSNMNVLDAGCGGGRYTAAWKQLGAGAVTGVDISSIGVASAEHRVREAELSGISFKQGSVIELPFPDHSFDIVFSNGVLHHTVDWQAGIREMVRVLKPGGLGWLYLIESPGGVFWATIEVLRDLMQGADREYARLSLKLLGIPDNRIFYMLDHVLVPINIRLTPSEIETVLAASGAVEIRRLTRGTDFDRIEKIHQGEPHAEVKYGVGENRYVFTRK
ncbi:MAG: class I SAM-dependent methyltransferase [Acidobacteriota bacterium]|nr:MAG: class I SAM-dependent methyltransferase [Acidobacteriota bacterium]